MPMEDGAGKVRALLAVGHIGVFVEAHQNALFLRGGIREEFDAPHRISPGEATRIAVCHSRQFGPQSQLECYPVICPPKRQRGWPLAKQIRATPLPCGPERIPGRGKGKTSHTTHGSDQAGDRADFLGEILRHQLEYSPIAHAEQRSATQRPDRKGQHQGPGQEKRKRHDPKENTEEHARPADSVREPSAQRAAQSRQDHKSHRAESGIGWAEGKLILEQARQINGEGDESAKGEEIEQRENPVSRSCARTLSIAPISFGRTVAGALRASKTKTMA